MPVGPQNDFGEGKKLLIVDVITVQCFQGWSEGRELDIAPGSARVKCTFNLRPSNASRLERICTNIDKSIMTTNSRVSWDRLGFRRQIGPVYRPHPKGGELGYDGEEFPHGICILQVITGWGINVK
jgi:hypothetical protein